MLYSWDQYDCFCELASDGMDGVKLMIRNLISNIVRWGVTNCRVMCRWEGVQDTSLTRWLMNECKRMLNHIQLDSLLLAPEMLIVLDPPTFKESPRYEVPTRTHAIWCGSPIWYVALIAIILRICLKSCFSTQDSGLLCLQEVRFAFLVSVSVTCVNGSFTIEGEGESEFEVGWE